MGLIALPVILFVFYGAPIFLLAALGYAYRTWERQTHPERFPGLSPGRKSRTLAAMDPGAAPPCRRAYVALGLGLIGLVVPLISIRAAVMAYNARRDMERFNWMNHWSVALRAQCLASATVVIQAFYVLFFSQIG